MNLLKQHLSILIAIIAAVDGAWVDRKITFSEWVKIAAKSVNLYKIVRNFTELISAYQALTDTERDALSEYFSAEFDLEDDKVEGYIEQVIAVLLQISGLITSQTEIRKPKPTA